MKTEHNTGTIAYVESGSQLTEVHFARNMSVAEMTAFHKYIADFIPPIPLEFHRPIRIPLGINLDFNRDLTEKEIAAITHLIEQWVQGVHK